MQETTARSGPATRGRRTPRARAHESCSRARKQQARLQETTARARTGCGERTRMQETCALGVRHPSERRASASRALARTNPPVAHENNRRVCWKRAREHPGPQETCADAGNDRASGACYARVGIPRARAYETFSRVRKLRGRLQETCARASGTAGNVRGCRKRPRERGPLRAGGASHAFARTKPSVAHENYTRDCRNRARKHAREHARRAQLHETSARPHPV